MRPSNKSRSRNKSGSSNQRRCNVGNIVNRVFESAGPDGKVRGTPQQVIEKYQGLARDAQVSGDRVAAENYLQHAEHYARLLGEAQRQTHEARQERDDRDGQRDEDQREHAPREPVTRDQREGQRDDQRDDQRGGPRDDQRDDRRDHGDERPRRRDPARQPEPAGLMTFGDDDRRGEVGPVETPESAAWSAQSDDAVPPAADRAPDLPEASQGANGQHREASQENPEEAPGTAQEAAKVEGEGEEAPKRPRRRRTTKQAAPVAEAPAD
jgi:hypothetical protein